MPPYVARDRTTGALRHFDAPNNRTVLLHLAAEMFEVALVKFEAIGEVEKPSPDSNRGLPSADDVRGILTEPPKRRGRPPKTPPESPLTPAPAGEAQQPSEALLAAESERANRLFERMSAIARNASQPPANAPADGGEGEARTPAAPPKSTPRARGKLPAPNRCLRNRRNQWQP